MSLKKIEMDVAGSEAPLCASSSEAAPEFSSICAPQPKASCKYKARIIFLLWVKM